MSRTRPRLQSLEDRVTPATLVGLTSTDHLITFDSATPGLIVRTVRITGVGQQDVVSIDARPASGLVYALTKTNKLYTVNPVTGIATRVGSVPPEFVVTGGRTGIDFNPTVDRLRVTSTADLNFRFNPVNGTIVDGDAGTPGVQPDTPLAFSAGDANAGQNPFVGDVAYDRNFQGATLTTLFGIDANLNALVRVGGVDGTPSPNLGEVFTVGNLIANPGTRVGFDIATDGTAFAAFRGGNGAGFLKLFTIDLASGAATNRGLIGSGTLEIDGLTVLPREEIVYAVTVSNRLISFRADQPERILSAVALQGLIAGESVTDIDFRPATGELIGLTAANRILRIDTATGQTTQLGVQLDPAVFAVGVAHGFDFNPAADRLRLVNTSDDNVRYNPLTFAVVAPADTDLAFIATDANVGQNPNIVGAAYDRNDNNGATATTLFGIDSGLNVLVRQGAVDGNPADVAGGGSPNGGLLTTLGSLGVLVTDVAGFDIVDQGSAGIGAALAVMQVEGETTSKLFSINLTAGLTNQPLGSATLVGTVAGDELIRAMAIAPPRIQFKKTGFTVNEAAGTATITLTRTGGTSGSASVAFLAFGNTATPTLDYLPPPPNTLITFNPGETTKTITITIVNDPAVEALETVQLSLALASGGNTTLGPVSSATLSIVSNE